MTFPRHAEFAALRERYDAALFNKRQVADKNAQVLAEIANVDATNTRLTNEVLELQAAGVPIDLPTLSERESEVQHGDAMSPKPTAAENTKAAVPKRSVATKKPAVASIPKKTTIITRAASKPTKRKANDEPAAPPTKKATRASTREKSTPVAGRRVVGQKA
ncbi:hypothetical protein HMN09_00434500 [Mycena chlorophos]|uniref:Uncharacterized protein n=1 Tax=Mycena chlorophos TaxID=658473 RepID=A0A8H6TGQ2_MYCCL|nr:hypothetical protein HMN09_00434500 [Mycena chlorophos]